MAPVIYQGRSYSSVGASIGAQVGPQARTHPATSGWDARLGARYRLLPLTVVAVLALGFLLRFAAAQHLTPHVDEAASVLAAHAVAERGVPILPSGTVYFQGAILSYLLAPFVWLGAGDLANLTTMRLVTVLAGTAAVYLSYRLGQAAAADPRVGTLAAGLVALDPLSVQWSAHVRMYAILQVLTVALAWIFVRVLTAPPTPRLLAGWVALFWAMVFTHVGAALLWPAMTLVALVVHRRALLTRRRNVVVALGLCLLAPTVLVLLNHTLGSASITASRSASASWLTFVGDHLLTPRAFVDNLGRDADWGVAIRASNLAWLVPALLVAGSTLAAGYRFVVDRMGRWNSARHRAVGVLLACYWIPVVAVGAFTVSPKERYLLHVHLLGYVLVAALAVDLLEARASERNAGRRHRMGVAYGIVALVIASLVGGLAWRLAHPVVHPDHLAAMRYVAARHAPGEPVIVALPTAAYLALGDADDLRFLAGPEDRPRAQRLTRLTDDGPVDYWIGVDSIVSARQLRALLMAHPRAWVVVDEERLAAPWAYAGAMAGVLREMTDPIYAAPGGALVLRGAPVVSDSGREPASTQAARPAVNRTSARSEGDSSDLLTAIHRSPANGSPPVTGTFTSVRWAGPRVWSQPAGGVSRRVGRPTGDEDHDRSRRPIDRPSVWGTS